MGNAGRSVPKNVVLAMVSLVPERAEFAMRTPVLSSLWDYCVRTRDADGFSHLNHTAWWEILGYPEYFSTERKWCNPISDNVDTEKSTGADIGSHFP